jgi:hypothetical protein
MTAIVEMLRATGSDPSDSSANYPMPMVHIAGVERVVVVLRVTGQAPFDSSLESVEVQVASGVAISATSDRSVFLVERRADRDPAPYARVLIGILQRDAEACIAAPDKFAEPGSCRTLAQLK